MNKFEDKLTSNRVINLPDGHKVRLLGAFDTIVNEADGAIRPIRLPYPCFAEFPHRDFDSIRTVVSNCSGTRIEFMTEADSVKLTVRCTRVDYSEMPGIVNDFVACVNGVVKKEITPSADTAECISRAGSLVSKQIFRQSSTLEFSGLGKGEKTVTIWLPPALIVDLLGLDAMSPIRISQESHSPKWLHYGSSISHCHTVKSPLSVWPVVSATISGYEIMNMGFSGQCMLDPFVARTIAHSDADVITISAGVNIVGARSMDLRTFPPAVHNFLDIIRERKPNTPIVLISSILWPGSDNIPGPSDMRFNKDGSVTCYSYGDKADIAKGAMTLSASREELRQITDERRKTDKNLFYLNGLLLFGSDDVGKFQLLDGLHPTEALYKEIGRRFSRLVFQGLLA